MIENIFLLLMSASNNGKFVGVLLALCLVFWFFQRLGHEK
jgi:hypothetical protein